MKTRKAIYDEEPDWNGSGITIPTNFITQIARNRTPRERAAMLWCSRYAAILDVPADALANELGLDMYSIRVGLTHPRENIDRFVQAVEARRAKFEANLDRAPGPTPPEENVFPERSPWHEAYSHPAETLVFKKVRAAVKMAAASAEIVEVIGLERLGKTTALRHFFLKNMHRAAWIDAPVGKTERDWLVSLAKGLTVGARTSLKNSQLRPEIDACLGANKIDILFVDEAHRLLPADLRCSPTRLEEIRSFTDRLGVSVVLAATPQFASMVAQMVNLADSGSSFYRPGQWIGRRQPFDLPETLKDEDLEQIVLWHQPNLEAAAVAALVALASANEGYIGTMVKVIKRARVYSDDNRLTLEHIEKARKQVDREARMAVLARDKVKVPRQPRRKLSAAPAIPNIVSMRTGMDTASIPEGEFRESV